MNELELLKQLQEEKLVKLNDKLDLTKASIKNIQDLLAMEKLVKDTKEELKSQLLDLMKSNNIKKIETPEILISYVEPTSSLRLDSSSLKTDLPDIYSNYLKEVEVKEQVKITERKSK